ncbi:MAG: response regulator [Lentimicrobiaceae bacterium]|jgi:CheY-like chemotaxis protein|nr:response regulator [Lentimicrobiaceae bacterium]
MENLNTVKILVADDNSTNQRLLEIYLKQKGWDCCLVSDGQKAVEEALKNRYDLILMDINMPRMNGIQATVAIRNTNQSVPIIALTVFDEEEVKISSKEAGINYFLAKPCRKEELISIISQYLPILPV